MFLTGWIAGAIVLRRWPAHGDFCGKFRSVSRFLILKHDTDITICRRYLDRSVLGACLGREVPRREHSVIANGVPHERQYHGHNHCQTAHGTCDGSLSQVTMAHLWPPCRFVAIKTAVTGKRQSPSINCSQGRPAIFFADCAVRTVRTE